MPDISQIVAASYPAVLNEMRKPENQWAESALMRELERRKAIKMVAMGPTIEHTLDYQRNPGSDFLATDLTTTSLAKVEVVTAAEYTPGQLSVPIVWSKGDDAKNPSENQKVAFVKALLENAITSHDDMIEEALFSTTTDGFLGLQTILPDSGAGTVGGIDASVDTWWANYTGEYNPAGDDLIAELTAAMNDAAKGSGGAMPDTIVTGAAAHAIYEGTQEDRIRYIDTAEADGGFKSLAFKTARVIFSPYGNTRFYGLNLKKGFFRLNVSKQYFRDKGATVEIPNMNGFVCKVYSMLQLTTNNKSRGFVLTQSGA